MAKCSFSFEFPITAEELVRRVDEAIENAGGEFSGDSLGGAYYIPTPIGPIMGTYIVTGQTIQIDVTQKPVILTCNMIGGKLSDIVRRAHSQLAD
jgi:hypothetical protein